ncbi:hypothetical protein, partial [Haloferax sp. Atlit-47N]|uniref:hypothetical protein n=1 Tax=Haloferax sp. Atlit-47N TaxID=2077199 RepID=UPI001F2FD01B
ITDFPACDGFEFTSTRLAGIWLPEDLPPSHLREQVLVTDYAEISHHLTPNGFGGQRHRNVRIKRASKIKNGRSSSVISALEVRVLNWRDGLVGFVLACLDKSGCEQVVTKGEALIREYHANDCLEVPNIC